VLLSVEVALICIAGRWSMKGLGSRCAGGTEDCVWSGVEGFEVQEPASDERVSR